MRRSLSDHRSYSDSLNFDRDVGSWIRRFRCLTLRFRVELGVLHVLACPLNQVNLSHTPMTLTPS
jgi:hypothetical protein